jgi:putative phosphoesterase
MRIAIVSDIHGNLAAFEAVLADLRETAPDLILHGGDISHGGSDPAGVVDRIRDLGWPGVVGNAEEMLFAPQSLVDFVSRTPSVQPLLSKIQEMGAWTCKELGAERLAWLSQLPMRQIHGSLALVHAGPANTYVSPWGNASDEDLRSAYRGLGQPLVVYGHIHQPFIRTIGNLMVANSGAVSQSFDGDLRASYLLVTDGKPEIRRVEYDVQREIQALVGRGLPHASWVVKILETGRPYMP